MPELPDVAVYVDALGRLYSGRMIQRIEVRSPFVVRTVAPDIHAAVGLRHITANIAGQPKVNVSCF